MKSFVHSLHFFLLMALLPHRIEATLPPLKTEDGFFKDPAGRIVILRGVNVGGDAKVPPFLPLSSAQQLDPLPTWGFNVIRLLFNWEAFETSPGQYQEEYLNRYKEMVQWANDRGLYVLVDIHQDGFSRFNLGGCGDGFPRWAIPPSVPTFKPRNHGGCRHWHLKILVDRGVKLSWKHFFNDTYGVRTRYLELLNHLSLTFKDHPGVVGYDLLNEPMGSETRQLSPLYQEGAQIIGKNHPQAVVFLSPQIFTGSGLIQSSLKKPERSGANTFAYSPHYYHPTMLILGYWKWPSLAGHLAKMRAKARHMGVPLFLGEFGMRPQSGWVRSYMKALYRQLEKHFLSGTQWNYTPHWTGRGKDGWNREDFNIVDGEGKIRRNFQVRPLVRKISGIPLSYTTVEKDGFFELEFHWDHRPETGELEIFLPVEMMGQNGEKMKMSSSLGGENCRLVSEERVVKCRGGQLKGPQWLRVKFPWK